MTALDCYGIVGSALVLLAFYFLRNLRLYAGICALIVLGIGAAAIHAVGLSLPLEETVLVAGVLLFGFGLLIVRVMFIRSVSLNMLRGIKDGAGGGFSEDIGARLGDMHSFGLIQSSEELNVLTSFGRLVSTVVAAFYALLRIKA